MRRPSNIYLDYSRLLSVGGTRRALSCNLTYMDSEKIVVLHSLGWIGFGGVEQRRALLAERLDKNRYRHILVCQQADGPLLGRFRLAGWEVHQVGVPRTFLSFQWYLRLARLVRSVRPHLIHGAVSEGNIMAVVMALAFRPARLITEETSDGTGRRRGGEILARTLYQSSTAVVAVSPAVELYLKARLKVSESKVRLLLNGVRSANRVSQKEVGRLRSNLGISDSEIVLGSVGRLLDSHKKYSDLIRAVPRILSRVGSVRLLIVGSGPDRDYLENIAEGLGISDHVTFVGQKDELGVFYELMDVFALPSAMESFGLVLAEAMFARVPIVATSVGGIPYVLENGRCGRLVEPEDPLRLADAILEIILNRSESQSMVERAHERATRFFGSDRYTADVERLWSEVLRTRPRAMCETH